MSKLKKSTIDFLRALQKNNNRAWFQDNKDKYLTAKEDFQEFVSHLLLELRKFDPAIASITPKDCIFRIYRDVRFSKDKSPYKSHFGAHIVAGGKKAGNQRAGYYLHLEPGNAFLAGGAYLPPSDWLGRIRKNIDINARGFKSVLNSSSFKKTFGSMEGETLKTSPRDYPKDHPEIALLKHKSFLATHQLTNSSLISEKFLKEAVKVFKALKPFNDFLNL